MEGYGFESTSLNATNMNRTHKDMVLSLGIKAIQANPDDDRLDTYKRGFEDAEQRCADRIALLENQVRAKQRLIDDNRHLLDVCAGLLGGPKKAEV